MIGNGAARFGNGRMSSKGQRKIARKPVSVSWISQPYPYHSCPICVNEIYKAQRTASTGAFAKPAITMQESRNPVHAKVNSAVSECQNQNSEGNRMKPAPSEPNAVLTFFK
jgi:hypothetical protein